MPIEISGIHLWRAIIKGIGFSTASAPQTPREIPRCPCPPRRTPVKCWIQCRVYAATRGQTHRPMTLPWHQHLSFRLMAMSARD